jgi:DNA adenine methylase
LKTIKPFLRWAGGKTWLTNDINDYLPSQFNNYYELFIGGGAILFHLLNEGKIKNEAIISDTNIDLINAYNVIKDSPDKLFSLLEEHENSEKYYYKIRSKQPRTDLEAASRFIFLNRTSFNGIYRENLKGEYNVPYGHKSYKVLFDYEHLLRVSNAIEKVLIVSSDFEDMFDRMEENDLVFLDPPYTVAHSNNGFVKYNQKIFSWEDQIRLAEGLRLLNDRNINFIITNAYHDSILSLYDGLGDVFKLSRYSVVGGKGAKREKYSEILISNI